MLTQTGESSPFAVLVSTPEKLQLVIRNKKVPRPLALVVMDEAHTIEDETRGLRIELLLASIKRSDAPPAHFLLLMPYVGQMLARWRWHRMAMRLDDSASDDSMKPNERIVGMYWHETDDTLRGGWRLIYQTLVTTPGTIHLGHIMSERRSLWELRGANSI